MKKLIVMLDFISGPLWKDIYDTKKKELVAGIDVVDYEYIQNLNDEILDLHSPYYKINYINQPVYFDKEQEKKDKYKMLDQHGKLMKRHNEVNDGSFEIDDRETDRVKIYKNYPVLGLGRD